MEIQANLHHNWWGNRMTFDFWNYLGGLISGLFGGALLTLHFTKTMRSGRDGNTVDQSGARARGDVVGRDKR
jgi:hypothetical protein